MKKFLFSVVFLLSTFAVAQSSDPCTFQVKQFARINLTTNTQVITGITEKKVHICSVNVVVAAATNVAIVEGTGTTCGTSTAALISGGTTAATGWNLAANGGIAHGNGGASIDRTASTGTNVCVLVSAANQTSGTIGYVIQ
jgi:hypothetical protein